ncbi:endolytic transglycosylase MltG [Desulfatitalea alkaliphila]|uniref:Endolytic murein transglycosylase n=1 Tax=Desulfatitalea alkaliphila TaxID=2929485 RepID=A0AA41R7G8_9BACT|nr:endolytic transglycosylase MltG [Desulfatitalea alkaliphila]MCJ8502376.1 endolytic transglycosylase MltG [Desulfatitalea alkaliphila]
MVNQRFLNNVKFLIRFLIALVLIIVAVAVWAWVDLQQFTHRPAGTDPTPIVIEVPPGASFHNFAAQLHRKGVIVSPVRFKILARLKQDDKRLKAGEYGLAATMTPAEVLDTVVNAKVLLHRLTIPEGFTIEQIAAEIDRIGITDAKAFKELVYDPQVVAAMDLEGPSLEGYLFPDTYYFPRRIEPKALVATMVNKFKSQFSDVWHARAKELNLSLLELVTLAAMIEKETGHPSERHLIASVFHNRIQRNMRLESDPTAVYGIAEFEGPITPHHLQTDSPYNTYRIRGLPLGPIANPGRAALEAALYPAESNYLFFVSKKDGSHHFSATYAEHNAAIRKYLRGNR